MVLELSFPINRIALRADARGKNLRDDQIVQDLNLPSKGAQLYFRDLGPQISWKTVPFIFLLMLFMRSSTILSNSILILQMGHVLNKSGEPYVIKAF